MNRKTGTASNPHRDGKPATGKSVNEITWPNAKGRLVARDSKTGKFVDASRAAVRSTSTTLDRALKRLADK